MEEPVKRDYSMPDSALAALATLFAGFATADLADVAKFGITAPKIAALVAKQEVFEGYPPDNDFAGQVTEATTAKDDKRGEIQVIIDEISTRAELEYANNRGRLNRFDFAKITNASDDLYLTKAEHIADLTEEYLADLTDRGQTQAQIDDFTVDEYGWRPPVGDVPFARRVGRYGIGVGLYDGGVIRDNRKQKKRNFPQEIPLLHFGFGRRYFAVSRRRLSMR